MGFTRNYKNLLMTMMCQPFGYTNKAEWEAIPEVYDNSTPFTIKLPDGAIHRLTIPQSYGLANTASEKPLYTEAYYRQSIDFGHLIGAINSSHSGHRPKYLKFGTGTSQEHIDDYKITEATINFVANPKTVSYSYENNKLVANYECAISSATAVTLTELGIYGEICYQYEYYQYPPISSSSTYCGRLTSVCLYRKLLETPIVLAAGEGAVVTFSIELANPLPDYGDEPEYV